MSKPIEQMSDDELLAELGHHPPRELRAMAFGIADEIMTRAAPLEAAGMDRDAAIETVIGEIANA